MTIWVSCVQFLSKLNNFYINKILNLKKVSFSKPPLPPFRQCPAKQQENQISFPPEGKTERQLLCIKGGRKRGKNRRKHVRARYQASSFLTVSRAPNTYFPREICMLSKTQVWLVTISGNHMLAMLSKLMPTKAATD